MSSNPVEVCPRVLETFSLAGMVGSFEDEMRDRARKREIGRQAAERVEGQRRIDVEQQAQQASAAFVSGPLHARLLKASEFLRSSGNAPEITLYEEVGRKRQGSSARPPIPRGAPAVRRRKTPGGGLPDATFVEVGLGWAVLFVKENSGERSGTCQPC